MKTEQAPLSGINAELTKAGLPAIPYRTVYTAAVDGVIPAERGGNGRWTFNPADVHKIAAALGVTSEPAAA